MDNKMVQTDIIEIRIEDSVHTPEFIVQFVKNALPKTGSVEIKHIKRFKAPSFLSLSKEE